MKVFGLILLFGFYSVSAGITFTDGGYDNILVAFNEQIKQPRDCSDVLDTLESSFYNLSSSLYRASGSRAYVRSVTVLLPRSWNLVACSRRSDGRGRYYGESYADADFRVVPTHKVLLDSVWTQQSKGCGEQGDYVNVPYSFFSGKSEAKERYGDLGKTLLHEWAKYRYGVFDEFGYPNDPLYPAWHRDNGQVSHSGCSNIPVVGSILGCDPTKQDCQFRPSATNNSEVRTSLMYMHFLPNVTDFCDANSHKDGPPTKHNILCSGRSTKEVILEHPDFRTSFQPVFANVSIIYKQPRPSRFVVALDTSSAMTDRDKWKFVRIALRRFLLRDMPNGTEVGMVSFSNRAEALTNVTIQLSSETIREQVISGIPDILDSKPEKCFRCAVEESIKIFEAGSSASPGGSTALGQTIIVITNGLSKNDVKSALELAKSKKVKISVISYGGKSDDFDLLRDVARESSGLLSVVPEEGAGSSAHLSMLIKLGDALLEILNHHQVDGSAEAMSMPVLVHEAEFPGPSSRKTVNGTFSIDSTLGETTFSVYFSSRDTPGVKNLRLVAPDGTVRVGQSEEPMASLYFSPVNPISLPGTWSYSFEQDASEFQSHFVKVTSRRKPLSPSLTAQLRFSSSVATPSGAAAPTVIYAEVKMGDTPVIDAAAYVLVSYKADNRTKEHYLQLLDNGKGDPDITAKDGIYSRYFIPPVGGEREYTMTLYVNDNSGKAYTVKTSGPRAKRAITVEPEASLCCGSVINIPQESREYIGAFQRVSRVPPKTIYASGRDEFPPSRITDLRATVIGQTVYLKWSAPGGDYDSGKAFAYELRYARSSNDLRTRFASTSSIEIYDTPLDYETPSSFNFTFTNYDVVYHFALKALDGDENKAELSNIVSVVVAAPPTTTTTTLPTPTVAPSRDMQGLSLAAILGIAAGAFLALVLIVLACCLAIYKRKRQTKDPKYQNSNLYNQTKPTGIVNNSLKEPEKLIRIGNDESDGKSLSVIYEANLPTNPPVHWSASQLLAEHERRQSPYVGQQNYHYETNNNPNVQAYYPGLTPENNGSVYNGYYHNAPTLPYPTHNERYSPYGRGSSPPSDSVHSGNSDGRMLPNEYDTSVEYSQNSVKVPPPTLPKPVRAVPPQQPPVLQGSFTSLVSDRKKRNITQV